MSWRTVPLTEVLKPVSRPVAIAPGETYRLLGAQWYAKGLFVREEKDGSEIRAQTLYEVCEGDFVYNRLFAWKGSFAVATAADQDGLVSNEFPCFTADRSLVEIGWLRWYFSQERVWQEALALSSGGTPTSRNRLKEDRFLSMTTPLPPLPEQRRIVARLDALGEKQQAAAALVQSADDESGILWSSCANSLLRSLEGSATRRLGDLVEIRGGGTPSKADFSAWVGDIPWITPKDMKSDVVRDSFDHISLRATETSPAKMIEPPAVLIVVRGMILARTVPVGLLGVRAAVNQDMKALLPRDFVSPEFLAWSLRARDGELLDLVERSTHDTRKLQTDKLLDLSVTVPSRELQKILVARFEALRALVSEMHRHREESLTELASLSEVAIRLALGGPATKQFLFSSPSSGADPLA